MKNFIAVIIILAVVILGAYYIASSGQTGNQPLTTPIESTIIEATPAESSPSTTNSSVGPVSVSIANFAFSPAQISVKTGTKVTWTNEDSALHTITSDTGTILNSATLSQGDSFSFTFTTPGTYSYHCSIHPMMKAVVVVTQ